MHFYDTSCSFCLAIERVFGHNNGVNGATIMDT
jgi:hypothetical protein